MRKKLIGILFILAMLLPILPIKALAAEDYGIRISGIPVNSNTLSGEGWSFDPKTYTLTLNNYQIGTFGYDKELKVGDANIARYILYITTDKTVTINLKGKNVIGDESYKGYPYMEYKQTGNRVTVYGIYTRTAPIVFKGDGSLLVSTHSASILGKDITFDNVNVKTQSYSTSLISTGTDNKITLKNGSHVNTYTVVGNAILKSAVRGNTLAVDTDSTLDARVDRCKSYGMAAVQVDNIQLDGGRITGKAYMYYADEGNEASDRPIATGIWVYNEAAIKNGGTLEGYVYNPSSIPYTFATSAVYVRGSLNFENYGTVRYYNEKASDKYKALDIKDNKIIYATGKADLFQSGTGIDGKISVSEREGIFLREDGGKKELSYYEDFRKRETFPENLTFDAFMQSGSSDVITVQSGSFELEPTAEKDIPKLVVKGGSLKFAMKEGKTYELNNPVEVQKGAELIVEGDGILKGLNITGEGTVRFKNGTVQNGKLGDNVNAVVHGGNIQVNNNGMVKDGQGKQASRILYRLISTDPEKILSVKPYSGGYDVTGIYLSSDNVSGKFFYAWLNSANYIIDLRVRVNQSRWDDAGEYTFVPQGDPYDTSAGPTVYMKKKVINTTPFGTFKSDKVVVTNPGNDEYTYFVYRITEGNKYPATTWSYSRDGGKTWERIYDKKNGKEYFSRGHIDINLQSFQQEYGMDVSSMDEANGWIFRAEARDLEYTGSTTLEQCLNAKITNTYEFPIYYSDPVLKTDKESYIGREKANITVEKLKSPDCVTFEYEWSVSKDGGKTFENLENKDSAYTVTVTPEMDGWIYRCIFITNYTDEGGLGYKVDWMKVTLHVNGSLPLITENPQDLEVTQGISGGSFKVNAEDADSYKWQVCTDRTGRNFEDIPGATNATYTISKEDVKPEMNRREYRCVVKNEYGSVTSEAVKLTVNYDPYISKELKDATIHEGDKIRNADGDFEYYFDRGNPRQRYTYEVEVSRDGGKTYEKLEKNPEEQNLGQGSEWESGAGYFMRGIVIKSATTDMTGLKFRGVMTYNGKTSYSKPFTLTVTPHTWDKGKIATEATCTDSGEKIYTCTECKATKKEAIEALGHDWEEATCTDPKTCTRCNKTEGEVLQHDYSKEWSMDSKSHWHVCNRCADETDRVEHIPDREEATEETPVLCKECGYVMQPQLAHTHHLAKVEKISATSQKDGKMEYWECERCGEQFLDEEGKESVTQEQLIIPKASGIKIATTSYTYNGKVRTPAVTVKDSKGKVLAKADYSVAYASGRKNVGSYTVTITLKNNYSGTVKKTFTIVPKTTSISKLTAGKKKLTVKWKKQTTQTTGYQLQYGTSSKFKGAKTVTITKNKTVSKAISKLKAKKKYYVRIRTYKTAKVNGKAVKLYSTWSKTKSGKTK